MKKWQSEFRRVLLRKLPVKVYIDPNVYNYRIGDSMGVEREDIGFEQICICVDELYKLNFDDFEGAVKDAGKYLIRLYNQMQYCLFAIRQDGTFAYMARASQRGGLKLKFERQFKQDVIKTRKGLDPFKPKKLSLCLLVTDRTDFTLPDETMKLLKRKYAKVILLDFSSEEVVRQIK